MVSSGYVDPAAVSPWTTALQNMNTNATHIELNDAAALGKALVAAGDGVLQRIRYHVLGAGLHLPEQLVRCGERGEGRERRRSVEWMRMKPHGALTLPR